MTLALGSSPAGFCGLLGLFPALGGRQGHSGGGGLGGVLAGGSNLSGGASAAHLGGSFGAGGIRHDAEKHSTKIGVALRLYVV